MERDRAYSSSIRAFFDAKSARVQALTTPGMAYVVIPLSSESSQGKLRVCCFRGTLGLDIVSRMVEGLCGVIPVPARTVNTKPVCNLRSRCAP